MSKKHFEALAAAFASIGTGPTSDPVATKRLLASMVAEACARFNPNFDRARFLAACGVEG